MDRTFHRTSTAGRWQVVLLTCAACGAAPAARPRALAEESNAERTSPEGDSAKRRDGIKKIYEMNVDGSDVRLLVEPIAGMRYHGSPSYSPDGQSLAFDATPTGDFRDSHVFVCSLEGPSRGQVEDLGPGGAPTWSPDGKRIAFQVRPKREDVTQIEGIWTMDADGENRKWFCEGLKPRWSPDGKRLVIAIEQSAARPSSVYLIDLNTKELTRVGNPAHLNIPGASVSPDGRRVAYIGRLNRQERELCITDLADGTHSVRLRGRIGWIPTWSADGTHLAFWYSKPSGETYIHTMPVARGQPPTMLKNQLLARINSDAVWSPDGKRIAFTSGD